MTKPNIYQRLNAVMKEVEYIQKGERTVNGSYRFVSHDQVTAKLHKPFVNAGIVVIPSVVEMIQDGNRTSVKLEVAFINMDDPIDRVVSTHYGHGIDGGGTKADGKVIPVGDKGIGKAVSYAFKYALLKTLMLETGDDPDNDATSAYSAFTEADIDKLIIDLASKLDFEEQVLMHEYMTFCKDYFKKKNKESWIETLHANLGKILEDVPKFVVDMNKWNDKRLLKALESRD